MAPSPGVPATASPDGAAAGQKPWPGAPVSGQVVPAVPASGDPPKADGGQSDKEWTEVVVPSESVIGLQLETALSSESARVEDRVDARVTRDVRVNGRIAIPAGTHAIGSVTLVEQGGKMKGRARIGIRFNTLVLADTSRVSINTETFIRDGESPSDSASAKIGGAAIGGAIIGAILGGGKGAAIGSGIGAAGGTAAAMTASRHPVVLPVGSTLSVRTQAPVTVTIEK
jgi:hypothetical protein